ncbi:MAG: radical SAM family heme chaperone HemW [Elusimicrobia bacterium]|nr:radical SAM family heme chaperone HemW [Elusimicrobiota bacterium]
MRGLYVHIPFCSVKCFYCDFTAFAGQKSQESRYLDALLREGEARQRPVDTLYIGGGTPSELSVEGMERLFAGVGRVFGPAGALKEATLEANPESLNAAKLEVLAKAGVRRLSLGLQTADPKLLKDIGRRHSVEQFLEVFAAARRGGFAVNVDLMYGLPDQTLAQAMDSLEAVLGLEPEHVSLYGLQVEDRTLFAKRGVEPDEDLGREMFERSLDRLARAGYRHYEISNFARPGHESVHNEIYWRNGEYVGLGCGASGYLDGERYANMDRLKEYCETVERGAPPAAEAERLDAKARLGETMLLGLRLIDGLALTEEMRRSFAPELAHVEAQGWVEQQGGAAKLTREGIFLANKVFEEFVPPFRS